MPIAQLFNTNNVVVGQGALFIAPANTPVPNIALASTTDPFSYIPFTYVTLQASATITAGSYTLTYTLNGVGYTTASQTAISGTAAALDTAITTALAPLGAGVSDVTVSGGPVSATGTPMVISLSEPFSGGAWTITPSGITGGTLSIIGPLWTPVGATDQGWKYGSAKTIQDITIEEQTTPVATTMSSQKFTIDGVLSEDISRTLQLVYNMTNTYTANGTGTAGYETLTATDAVLQYAVVLVMANQLTFPRWLYVPQNTCLGNVDTTLRRAAAKRMYSAAFSSTCPTASIKIYNVLQAGS